MEQIVFRAKEQTLVGVGALGRTVLRREQEKPITGAQSLEKAFARSERASELAVDWDNLVSGIILSARRGF